MSETPRDIGLLLERVISPFRARSASGRILSAPAWHDLSPDDRETAYLEAVASRQLEAALDPDGLSSTGRAVLGRVRR